MYLGENAEPREQVTNPPTKTWCTQKSKNNPYTNWNGICRGCCVFCDDRESCTIRTCYQTKPEDLCCYQNTPAEWMMSKIDEEAYKKAYQLRRVEFWLKKGFKEGDGSWEGEAIADLRKRYGKNFGKASRT